ncbi:MAG: DUF4136 domain-containing protein [Porticoccaceae bacterium]
MTSLGKRCCSLLALLIAGVLITACASGPAKPVVDYKPDYDFSQTKTIAFYEKSGQVSGDNPMQLSDIQKERIDQALGRALGAKGLTMVDDVSQADMLVSWHLVTQFKTEVRSFGTSPLYDPFWGYNRYSLYSCWSCMPMYNEVSSDNYTEGTFIVDMIDPTLEKSVWRGITQSRLRGNPNADQSSYDEAAVEIFRQFPPAPAPLD